MLWGILLMKENIQSCTNCFYYELTNLIYPFPTTGYVINKCIFWLYDPVSDVGCLYFSFQILSLNCVLIDCIPNFNVENWV